MYPFPKKEQNKTAINRTTQNLNVAGGVLLLTLLRNIRCFRPADVGEKDIVIAGHKIYKIAQPGTITAGPLFESIVDCSGLCAFPGFVDQHVHLTGAGGEQGFGSRLRELEAGELFGAGVTTVVGLLGADGLTRSMEALYAKAKSLNLRGLTAYIYSGSYCLPPVTLTGSLLRDMVLIESVVGAGEIAVSDHRSSNPDARALVGLASEIHLGGLLSGKGGVLHLHVGDGKDGLRVLKEALEMSDLPADMFVPTHTNRNGRLFKEAVDYCRHGGRIDLTAGEKSGLSVASALRILIKEGIDLGRVTVSSDAGGSTPEGGSGDIRALFDDFSEILQQAILQPQDAIRLFAENPAAVLKLFPRKGALCEGGDADILVMDGDYAVKMLYAMGVPVLDRNL
jgi:beta-aspartyl-dipeptidase (metallo-type)